MTDPTHWPCGHPRNGEERTELRCGVAGCDREPVRCLVFLDEDGLRTMGEPAMWVWGHCRRHRGRMRRLVRGVASSGGMVASRRADLEAVVGWFHSDPDRCAAGSIRVVPGG